MYRVVICEDEKVHSREQETICRAILEKLNIEYKLSMFETGEAFWTAFFKGERYDLLLLDIVMDETNGIELARKIRAYDNDAAIVFITNHSEYALQGYDVSALHYLMKPLESDRLERIIAADYTRRFQRQFLVIKSGVQNLRIPVTEIICLETAGRRVLITLRDGTVEYSGKLSALLEELPGEQFVRCHVGYVVNLSNIRELTRTDAVAVNGKTIPISRAYSKTAQKAFLKQMWDA